MSWQSFLSVVAIAIGLVGCQRVNEPIVGHYRAVLDLPGGEAPFGLDVAQEDGRYVLYLLNGAERTRVPNVTAKEGELKATFPGYENRLQAKLSRKGMQGSITLMTHGGEEQVIPFRADLGKTHRFHERASTDNADVEGSWAVTFTDAAGKQSQAVALFEQDHDRVTGTVTTPTGDHRHLDGQISDDALQLSTFAGGLVYLYKLNVTASGDLQGEYWQGIESHERVDATRRNMTRAEP